MAFLGFNKLSEPTLKDLATSLQGGRLSAGLSEADVRSICGNSWEAAWADLNAAYASGFSIPQLAVLVDAIYEARVSEPDPERLFELILTGPHMKGAEVTSTETMFHRMVDLAQEELIIAGYLFYNGKALFNALAAKMQANPNFNVTFCVNIERKEHDTTSDMGLIEKFKYVFSTYNWPSGCRLPNIYYFPPALKTNDTGKAVMHSKCVIIDGKEALVTSANFTGNAQRTNLEAGVLVKDRLMVKRLRTYFVSAIESRLLEKVTT
jgi:phosphatidylserine/phosphatidylglycerophosphate/cardiolipin synthase-like enzyme